LIPILKHVPARFAKWKRDCAKTRKLQRDLYFSLLDETKQRLSKGEENGSYMEEVLTKQEEFGVDREITGSNFRILGIISSEADVNIQVSRRRADRRRLRHDFVVYPVSYNGLDRVP
jgi:hypothetical protein